MSDSPVRVLVVDDDPGLLAVLEAGLEQQGYAVKPVDNARGAQAELARGGWDLLVSDYSLGDPLVNGLALLRQARLLPDPPLVIMITAFSSMQLALESINEGVHDFLTKPFQIDELFLAARNAAALIELRRRNAALETRIGQLADALLHIEQGQSELMERLGRMEYDGAPDEGFGDALGNARALELRRRRLRDGFAVYFKAGESLSAQIAEQRRGVQEAAAAGKQQ